MEGSARKSRWGDFSSRQVSLTPEDRAELERELGPPTAQTLGSVRCRAFLLWIVCRKQQTDLTLGEVEQWGSSVIASASVSHFLRRALPELGIEEPDPLNALRPRRQRRHGPFFGPDGTV
jgi:hypothetical protein